MKIAMACLGLHFNTHDIVWDFLQRAKFSVTLEDINLDSVTSIASLAPFNALFCCNQTPDALTKIKSFGGFSCISSFKNPYNLRHICTLVQDFSKRANDYTFNITLEGRICKESIVALDLGVERTLRSAFEYATDQDAALVSVDLSCSLATEVFWRQCVADVRGDYPGVALREIFLPEAAKYISENNGIILVGSKLCADALDCLLSTNIKTSMTINTKNFGIYESNFSLDTTPKQEIVCTIKQLCDMLAFSLNFTSLAKKLGTRADLAYADCTLNTQQEIMNFVFT